MNILDILAERKSKAEFIESKNEARDYFLKQKSALEGISQTAGFLEIRDYWLREVESCANRCRTAKKEDIREVQAQWQLAQRFLDFLDNILKPLPQVEDDEDFISS